MTEQATTARWATWTTGTVACVDTGRPEPEEQAAGVPGRGGEVTTILCLHGIGSSSASFGPQLAELWPSFRVVAWDAPGYGASPDPGSALGLGDYAIAAAEVAGQLDPPVHLLGVSWGGVLALEVVRSFPELVRSVVLVGASRGSGRSPQSRAAMEARVRALEELGPAAFAAGRAAELVSPGAPPELVGTVRRIMTDAVRLPGYRSAAQSMIEADLTGRLGSIDRPVLVAYGEHDTVTGRSEAEAIAAEVRGAVTVSIASAGHLANQERPVATNAWVSSFIDIVDRLAADATGTTTAGAANRGGQR